MFPPFRLDPVNQCLWRADDRIHLAPKAFAVLQYLADHAGRLVTPEQLLEALWPDTFVQPEVLRRYILDIRRVLGDPPKAPRFVETLTQAGLPVHRGHPGRSGPANSGRFDGRMSP